LHDGSGYRLGGDVSFFLPFFLFFLFFLLFLPLPVNADVLIGRLFPVLVAVSTFSRGDLLAA